MQHAMLSAAQISTLCGVDEHTVEQRIEEGCLFSTLREHATDRSHWRVPRDHVRRLLTQSDQPSDPTVLIVTFSPARNSSQVTAEVRAQIYEVGPDTLDALCHWLDLGGEPVSASDDLPAFGDRLERLFALITQPDGTPFTNKTIAKRAGLTDGKYVWKLRNTKKRARNPKLSTVTALARAFGVSPIHFFVHSDVCALMAKDRQSKEEMPGETR